MHKNLLSNQGISKQISQALTILQSQTTTITSDTELVKQGVTDIYRQLQKYEPLLMLLPHIHTESEVQQQNSIPKLISALTQEQALITSRLEHINKSSLLQGAPKEISEFEGSQTQTVSTSIEDFKWGRKHKMGCCTCKSVYKASGLWRVTSNLLVTTKSTKSHRKTCPQYNALFTDHTNVIGMRALLGGFLMHAVEISIF